jgi:hypothetical protein
LEHPREVSMSADQERAAIVAWLRDRRMSFGRPTRNAQAALNIAADRIERGEHLPPDRQALRDDKRAAALSDLAALDGETM